MYRILCGAVIVWIGAVAAGVAVADQTCRRGDGDLGKKTATVFTGSAQAAAQGTANVVQTSVCNTPAAPMTAVAAVRDTADTAFDKADAAIKTFTGQDSEGAR